MDKYKFNPTRPFCVEVYETTRSGKPRIYGVQDLTFKQAKEYFDRMEPDTKFKFFRIQPDGTRIEIKMDEQNAIQFGIWKPGRWDEAGEWMGPALMKICDTEAEAEANLKFYPPNYYIEPF